MSKSHYHVGLISKAQCTPILLAHHYLSGVSRGFKSGVNCGLYYKEALVGVCIFTGLPVPELVKGMYGLERDEQTGFYELSRLCLRPEVQLFEHNLASWFVSRSIRLLKKGNRVRSILSYADEAHHKGVVYRACNFTYYGLTDKRKDFWIAQGDGTYVKHSRGKTKGVAGEWRDRSRKHRFVLTFDKSLRLKWPKS